MPDPIRVAVIGAGNIAQQHLPVLLAQPDARVVALCDAKPEHLQATAQKFAIERTFPSVDALHGWGAYDAVYVLISAVASAAVAERFVRHKVPTFLEKPPGLYVHETERLVRAVEQTGTTLQVGLNRRFYTSIQAGRAAILATGPVLTINVDASEDGAHIWTDPRLVLASRKRRIFTNSIHPLDLLRYFGGDVREVVSFVDRYVHPAPDCFTAWIKFQSGATGRAAVDHFATRGGNWGFQVRTAEATLTSYDGYLRVVFERRGKEPVEFGLTGDDLRFKPGFPGETRAFLDLVRTGGQPRFPAVSIQDALLTMRLIDSIAQSPAP